MADRWAEAAEELFDDMKHRPKEDALGIIEQYLRGAYQDGMKDAVKAIEKAYKHD